LDTASEAMPIAATAAKAMKARRLSMAFVLGLMQPSGRWSGHARHRFKQLNCTMFSFM
jgi:hypothetical protein